MKGGDVSIQDMITKVLGKKVYAPPDHRDPFTTAPSVYDEAQIYLDMQLSGVNLPR